MKIAIFDGVQIEAGPDAPGEARCPECNGPVELRSSGGQWYYRHIPGSGAACPARLRPLRVLPLDRGPELVDNDPLLSIAVDVTAATIAAARRRNLEDILALAFSPLIHHVLALANLDPEDVLDWLGIPPDPGEPEVVVIDDEEVILNAVAAEPGPVLDIRTRHNGHIQELEALEWYVPLPQDRIGPARLRLLARVLAVARRAYVLGSEETWSEIAARIGISYRTPN